MSLAGAYAATVRGQWDRFDQVVDCLDQLITRLNALDADSAAEMGSARIVGGPAPLIDAFFGTEGAPTVEALDVRAVLIGQLQEARRQVEDACTLAQAVEAALVD